MFPYKLMVFASLHHAILAYGSFPGKSLPSDGKGHLQK